MEGGGRNGAGVTLRGFRYQPVSRKRGTGHERATVFVNVTTKLSAVPRLTRHSLKFHREIAPQARRAMEEGGGGRWRSAVREFSHFVHCACPRFDNTQLARRHESDPRRPLSLIFHRCTLELSRLNPDYDARIDNRLLKGLRSFGNSLVTRFSMQFIRLKYRCAFVLKIRRNTC